MGGRTADLILHNGKILTMDEHGSVAQAVAVAGNRIAAVGSDDDLESLAGPYTERIDLQGRTVTPGFIDAHIHVELSTYAREYWLDVREIEPAAVLARVREQVESLPPGSWVVGQATFGQELPTREELDRVAPDHPVALRRSMHQVIANSRALALGGIDRHTPEPAGARIERDGSGEPTGLLEEGFDLLPTPRAGYKELKESLRRMLHDLFLAQGITTVYELPISAQAIRAYQELRREGRLPVRLALWYTLPPGHQPIITIDEIERIGLQTGFGDDWLSFGGVKIFVDGDGKAALWFDQLTGRPSEWGLVTRTYQELTELLARAFRAGVQPWIHAVGDAAQEMAIDALADVTRMFPERADHRARIEHVGNERVDPRQLERIRAVGAIPVPTAAFLHSMPDDHEAQLAPNERAFIYRTLIDQGFHPPGNSDTAGTQPFAINPFYGIYCLVARKNRNGVQICPEEAIEPEEALRVYTAFSAYSGFQDRSRGTIEPGKLADMAVLSADPLQTAPDDLLSIQVQMTILDGKVAFRR